MSKDEQLFAQLVYLFHATAMQALGKIKNPVTEKIDRNLEQAEQSIDMLNMLKARTANNLSANEQRLLEMTLSELRLNFVDEKAKG